MSVVMFAGLVVDGGLALAAKLRAIGEAQEAARAGAQSIDLAAYRNDGSIRLLPVEAQRQAHAYLASIGATGTVKISSTTVTVTVTVHQRPQFLGILGVGTLTVTATGTARPVRGVEAPSDR
ncbi:hypothetical protein MQV74_05935 [Streptomyces sp. AN091965]|nr:hypothetical protein [Streptomyces sp. AN091965]